MDKIKDTSVLVSKGEISNYLITSPKRGKLGVSSTRLLAFMIAQINLKDKEFTKYKINRHNLKKHVLRCADNLLSREINTMCAELATHAVKIDWGNGTKEYSAIAPTILYNDKDYWIEFVFNERLKPHLLDLKGHFTKYQLETVFSLKSTYAFYAYMYFKKYIHGSRKSYKFTVGLQDFKDIISASSKYQLYGHFKDRVLKPLQEEFEELADITFSFKEIKQGRKVAELEFIIFKRKDFQPTLDMEPETVELTDEQKESQEIRKKAKAYWNILPLDQQEELKKDLEKENTLWPLDTEHGIIQALSMSQRFIDDSTNFVE